MSSFHVSWRTHVKTWLQFITHRRLAPYHPIPALHETLRVAALHHNDTLCDLGCGDGNTLIHAIQQYHIKHAYGYELNKELYNIAQQRIVDENLQSSITLYHRDARVANLNDSTVILLYLSIHGNKSLLPILTSKLQNHPDTRIVSYLFPIPTLTPVKTIISKNGSIPIMLYTGKSLMNK